MTVQRVLRLIRKFAVLGILVACLGFLSLGTSTSKAVVCCSTCEPSFEECTLGCGDPPLGACLTFCNFRLNRCFATCDPGC